MSLKNIRRYVLAKPILDACAKHGLPFSSQFKFIAFDVFEFCTWLENELEHNEED